MNFFVLSCFVSVKFVVCHLEIKFERTREIEPTTTKRVEPEVEKNINRRQCDALLYQSHGILFIGLSHRLSLTSIENITVVLSCLVC